MKPTVYLRLADLRPAGVCQSSASSPSQFSGGRIATRGLWIEVGGRQVGMNDHRNQNAGGTGHGRTG